MDSNSVYKHLDRVFQRNGRGAQKRALEAIRMKASTFRMAKKNNSLRVRDLLAILEALGEETSEFFAEIEEEEEQPPWLYLPVSASLRPSDKPTARTIRQLDGKRFDSPVGALRDLFGLRAIPEGCLWLRECAIGSCYRFLDRYTEARQHLSAAAVLVGSQEQLAETLERTGWAYFLDNPGRSMALFQRAGFLFSLAGQRTRSNDVLVDQGIVAFHSRRFRTTKELIAKALKEDLGVRYRAYGQQFLGLVAFEEGDAGGARSWFRVAEESAATLDDRYTRGSLLWSFAKIENGPRAEALYERAVLEFGSDLIFHAVCCGIDKLGRGIGDENKTLGELVEISKTSELPSLGDLLFDFMVRRQSSNVTNLDIVNSAVRQKWEKWRTAQLRKLASLRESYQDHT